MCRPLPSKRHQIPCVYQVLEVLAGSAELGAAVLEAGVVDALGAEVFDEGEAHVAGVAEARAPDARDLSGHDVQPPRIQNRLVYV
jgi:hypothetical protein